MRGESAGRAVTRGADLLTGRDRVDGDRYQVDTVGGRGGFAERGERGGVFGRKWWRVWPLQVSLLSSSYAASLLIFFKLLFLFVSFQTGTGMMQNYNLAFVY